MLLKAVQKIFSAQSHRLTRGLMNELFENFLNQYQIDKRFIEPISDELLRTYSKLTSVDKVIIPD